jgi:hypothetical protein
MASNTYDEFRSTIDSVGLGPLPRWSGLDERMRAQSFRVLRRLAVARALDGGDAFSAIEVEAGLGEDAALRTFLLSTAVLIASESGATRAKRDAIGVAIEEQVPEPTLSNLLDACWVYRDENLVAWTPLHAVGCGFACTDDDDFERLTRARSAWDTATPAQQVDLVGQTISALMQQYARGEGRAVESSRQVFGDQEVMRGLAAAAAAERMSLLSDGAFAAIGGEVHVVGGIEVKLDDDEAYVQRSAIGQDVFTKWSADLATWRPDGGEGETAFAWGAGLAMVVSGGSVAGWLRRCAEALLAGRIQSTPKAA